MANILDNFKKMGGARMMALVTGAAMVVAALVVFSLWGFSPDYQVLYSGLTPADSGAVIEKLRDRGIPYKVEGSAISVPAELVYEARMDLAGEGLPQGGGVGYEIFDNTGFGVTQFVQKINYKRALQGELARTISQIKEVESARVHLAIPDKGVFLSEKEGARASVVLKLRAGASLTREQVAAITQLTANSFENLDPADVAVVDTTGRMWSGGGEEQGAFRLTAAQLEYKGGLERELENRVQTMLEKTVGAGKVVARISADVDTRHIERTEESYDPESQVVRSEQRNKEKITGGSAVAGVPGVLSNLPETSGGGSGGETGARSQRQDEVINYEINKVVSHVIEPVNSINRLTVSVLVDGSYNVAEGEDGQTVRTYVPRKDEEIAAFTEMVKAAVGFTAERGDVVHVTSMPFEQSFAPAEMPAEEASVIPPQLIPSLIKYASVMVVSIFAIFFILRPLLKSIASAPAGSRAIGGGVLPQASLPEGEGALGAGAPAAARSKDAGTVNNLKNTVKENPQQAAMILKGWVKEK